jgi:guanylate kinase
VREALARGELVVLDIDVQGAENVRRKVPESLGVFVLPPSEEELLKRLRARGREAESAIARRFAESKKEIARAHEGSTYDAFVVNDTLPRVTDEVAAIVAARLAANRAAR